MLPDFPWPGMTLTTQACFTALRLSGLLVPFPVGKPEAEGGCWIISEAVQFERGAQDRLLLWGVSTGRDGRL